MSLLPVGFGASGDDYEITDSLRIRNSASASLQRYNATETNRRTFTYSGWFKLGYLNNDYWFQSARYDVNNFTGITINLNQGLGIYQKNGGSITWILREAGVKRDFSGWYHFVVAVDTTQSTSTDRVKLYVNGVLSTSFTSASYPSQNLDTFFNTTTAVQTFAQSATTGNAQWDGYVTETHFIDGQQLTADDFGEYDANGTWKAKEYTGTYGTNGFYLPMKPTTQAELQNTVLYAGDGASASINGVGYSPDFVWIKSRSDTYHHRLYDTVRGSQKMLSSSQTAAEQTKTGGLTSFDSDGFSIGNDSGENNSGDDYVAWTWDAGDNQPSTGHSSVSYKGTGSPLKVSGLGFSPDLVWIKSRSNVGNHGIWDSVRGASNVLKPNITDAESSISGVISFDADGYTLGSSYNASGGTYVAWGWDAGDGDPVSNTDGSITSTVKANDATGFSIVTYTGTGANATVGHGLGVAPKMVICKARSDTGDWQVYHAGVGATKLTRLNLSDATITNAIWQNTAPTSTVFSIGASPSINKNGATNVAYCFSEVSGVSKFDSYTGTGAGSHAITTGFRPGFVMIKRTDSANSWTMIDATRNPFNIADSILWADLTDAEASGGTTTSVNFTDTGFELNGAGGAINASGGTYIYMAFKGSYSDYVSPLNDTGTIDSRVKANPDKGFSIVSYEGTPNGTVGHGLSAAPKVIIQKDRDNSVYWRVFHYLMSGSEDYDPTDNLHLNATNAYPPGIGQATRIDGVTSTTFTSTGGSTGSEQIAYCWTDVAGYSKFGSYTGTGSAGNSVTGLGFQPAWLMIKETTSTGNWAIIDTTRSPNYDAQGQYLWANLSSATGGASAPLTFDSDGFTINSSDSDTNTSGQTYIYMAFADTRDAVFNFDASGNKNNFDVLGSINSNAESETTYDLMKDTPSLVDENAANFATLNPLDVYPGRQFAVDGNLKWNDTSGGSWGRSTISVTSGKWYWEVSGFTTTNWFIGVSDGTKSITNYYAYYVGAPTALVYLINGNTYIAGSNASFISAIATTDVVGFVVDADAGSLAVYKNNVLQGTITGLSYGSYSPMVAPPAAGSCVYNFGQRPLAYTPPTGSKKLNTFNLSDSTIEDASQHFEALTRNGFGSSGGTVATNFQADLIWEKPRNAAYSHYIIDNVRGIANGTAPFLSSNTTSAEQNANWYLPPTSSTIGFNSSDWSTSTTLVDWIWKANGSGVSNTVGTIPSTVSANTEAGFSIVSFTGNGVANATVGHGLNANLAMVVQKSRTDSGTAWLVWHKDLPNAYSSTTAYISLHNSNAANTTTLFYNGSLFSDTVFALQGTNTSTNNNGSTYVTYCFHSVEGYSAFGSYTGNGSTDGTFVYTGFRPAWIMVKRYTATGNWQMFDSSRDLYNPENGRLYANLTDAENDQNSVDFVSNGFKLRDTSGDNNSSGQSYIYMAFAENPFKNSNAR